MCGLTHVTVAILCSSCSLQQYLVRSRQAALNEAGLSLCVNVNEGTQDGDNWTEYISIVSAYSLFMHNKLQYTWRRDYCKCVQPAQLPVSTDVQAPSLLEQHPLYVPHRTAQNTPSLYMQLLSEGNILYWVLSSGVRLIFYTTSSDGVLLVIFIKHITN